MQTFRRPPVATKLCNDGNASTFERIVERRLVTLRFPRDRTKAAALDTCAADMEHPSIKP